MKRLQTNHGPSGATDARAASLPSAGRRLQRNPDVVSTRLGDGGVLVHLQTNRIFELNATGVRIWELLENSAGLAEIETALATEFDVAPARLHADISALIGALVSEGLVREIGS